MTSSQLIVLEGVDGAGTTTHAKLLADALRADGLPIHTTREPSDGPVGVLLRQILRHRVVVPGVHGPHAPGWTTMAMLFAADRLDHLEAEIEPNLRDGVTVITDRYVHSSIAYQSLHGGGDAATVEWVRNVNARVRQADLTIVLDIPWEVAARRRRLRAQSELYEQDAFQKDLCGLYLEIDHHFPGQPIVHVDSNRPTETVARDILGHVQRLRAERKG